MAKRGPKPNPAGEREHRMAAMYRQGLTLEKIGQHFAITRERVRQLLRKHFDFTADDGGVSVRSKARAAGVERTRALSRARTESRWGVEWELLSELRANGTLRAYIQQRTNADRRAIKWDLHFADWYAVWQASGKLHLRGRGKGKYCLSRIKDDGPYALGNVHVQLATENSSEATKKWIGKTKAHRGVFCLYPGRELAWLAQVGKVRLGFFASVEEAAAARAAYMQAHGIKPAGKFDGYGVTRDSRPAAAKNPFRLYHRSKYVSCHPTREAALQARELALAAVEAN
jgi:hypothetical protein